MPFSKTLLIVILLTQAGTNCSWAFEEAKSESVHYVQKTESSECEYYVQLPGKGLTQSAMSAIGEVVKRYAFGFGPNHENIDTTGKSFGVLAIERFKLFEGDGDHGDGRSGSSHWSDGINVNVVAEWADFLCVQVMSSFYTGGAHGSYAIKNLIFEKSSGIQINESDIFNPEMALALADSLKSQLIKSLERDGSTLEEMGYYDDAIKPNGNICLTSRGHDKATSFL